MNRVNSLLKNFAAILFGLSVSLILIEGGYRIYLHIVNPPAMYYPGGKSLRPNGQGMYRGGEISLDLFGFRNGYDKSIFLRKKRLLVLGDSTAFGMGVNDNETFTHHLNQIFKSRDWAFINLGRPGRDTASIRDTLLTYEKAFLPYLGLIWIYNINDAKLSDDFRPPNFNTGSIIYSTGTLSKMENRIWPYLRSPTLIKHLTQELLNKNPRKLEMKWQEYYNYCLGTFKPDSKFINFERRYLDQVVSLANHRKIPLFFVIVPVLDQFSDNNRGPQEFLSQFESKNVVVVDILKELSQYPDHKELYLPNDSRHFSEKGNRMIAKQISETLKWHLLGINVKKITNYPDRKIISPAITP
jgi:lysophospholipase L1-like esterase